VKAFYGRAPSGVEPGTLQGHLIVIEGPDSSGRTTQVTMLSNWLRESGYAVAEVGLKRSVLVSTELEKAKQGNVLGPRTMSLFYATDFYDQLENIIAPALQAGTVVIADRYIYTLIARDMVRGANQEWLHDLFSMAIVPDTVYYLNVPVQELARRTLESRGEMDYWESGMDLGLARDWYQSFRAYQERLNDAFQTLRKEYSIEVIDGDRSPEAIHTDIRSRIAERLPDILVS
jgi:dTMP kinase